jgi:hypothetical protein
VNKKKQKNFSSVGMYEVSASPLSQGGQKFFGSFFKKNYFLFLNTHKATRTRLGIVVGRRSRLS